MPRSTRLAFGLTTYLPRMLNRVLTLFCLACLLGSAHVRATHIMGANLSYRPVGGNPYHYELTHHVFYDCGGGATLPHMPISANPTNPPWTNDIVIEACNGATLTPAGVLQSYLDVTPVCPQPPGAPGLTLCDTPSVGLVNGIAEVIFTYDVNLFGQNCSTFQIYYEQCCRNDLITSLTDPLQDGLTVGPWTIDLTLPVGNRSPTFLSPSTGTVVPKMFICAGQKAVLDFSGTDPDGDSLVYSLTACMSDTVATASYDYASGFSPQAPLGTEWQASMDSETGFLTLTPDAFRRRHLWGLSGRLVWTARRGSSR